VVVKDAADWLAFGALFLAVCTIAWQGYRYVNVQKDIGRQRNFENFFHTLERVNNRDRSLILQKAAIFELRNYPEYKDVVLNICDDAKSLFATEDPRVLDEFEATASFLRAKKND
jgi:hypothetical protein